MPIRRARLQLRLVHMGPHKRIPALRLQFQPIERTVSPTPSIYPSKIRNEAKTNYPSAPSPGFTQAPASPVSNTKPSANTAPATTCPIPGTRRQTRWNRTQPSMKQLYAVFILIRDAIPMLTGHLLLLILHSFWVFIMRV